MSWNMTPQEARRILAECEAPLSGDFHTLSSDTVFALLEYASQYKYRKPRNANGSRGRYWHAYLQQVANRGNYK